MKTTKRLLSLVLVAVLALGVFALSACDYIKQFISDLTGGGEVETQPVTSEQWSAALKAEAFENVTAETLLFVNGKPATIMNNKGNLKMEYVRGDNAVTEYGVVKDGKTLVYNAEGYLDSTLEYDYMQFWVVVATDSLKFENYNYDETAKAYVLKEGVKDELRTKITFANGNLAKVEFDDGTYIQFSKYGTTEFTMPELKDTLTTVSEAAFNAALAKESFANVTVTRYEAGNPARLSAIYEISGKYMCLTENATSVYYASEGNKVIMYDQYGFAALSGESSFYKLAVEDVVDGLKYADFTYDEEAKVYKNADGSATLEFKNGKLISVTDGGVPAEFGYYNTTTVTMPQIKTSQKVTEQAWNKALEAANFANVTVDLKLRAESTDGLAMVGVIYKDGNVCKQVNELNGSTSYYIVNDGTTTLYDEKGDVTATYDYDAVALVVQMFVVGLKYSDYTYNEDIKAYVYSGEDVGAIAVYFEDGHITCVQSDNDGRYVAYSDYGKTTVTLPFELSK